MRNSVGYTPGSGKDALEERYIFHCTIAKIVTKVVV